MFKVMSKKQKIAYSKQFSSGEINSYRKGKRNGYLDCLHKSFSKRSGHSKVDYRPVNIKDIF